MVKGVNTATSNAQRVKVGDYGSQITIQLDNVEKDTLQAVEWVRAYPVNDPVVSQYVDIPDHTVTDGILFITLPEITRGTYNIEIKDTDGRIYPAEGALRLEMLPSTKDASEVYYVTYKELILNEVEGMVEEYILENPDGFKGPESDITLLDQVTINKGKTYPLKNVSRDGQTYSLTDEVKNTVLDVKVHGAEKGKYYVLMYVANGLNGSYGFTIGEYNIEPDGGFKHSTRTTLATYNNGGKFSDEPKSDIVHRTLNIPNKSLTFDIIYDRTAINVYPLGLDINNTQGGKAIGAVIHPNNYIYNQNVNNAPDEIERTNNKVCMDKKADRFTIYTLKSNGNYIGIEIRRQSKGIENTASSNFDLWLVRTIKEYSRAGNGFTPVRSIIDDSVVTTMDLMIRESSKMDYMGGINHGDEINDFAMILVDGKPIDMASTGFYEAKEIRLIQRNKLYRDTVYTSGELNHLATVGKEHAFNYEDGYTLHNRVTWHESIDIVESYLGSLSLYREDEKGNSPLWHTVISDITHTPYDLKTVGGQMSAESDVDRVILLGENLSCTVEIDRFKNVPGNKIHVANFAEKYSKLYISYVPSDYTTSVDEVWKQSTKFNFELS